VSAVPHAKLEEAERELRRALGKAEFRLVYQAELSLESGRVLGAEALLRWDHPTRGRLSPQHFIADAEVTGLIIPIGTWAIRQACRQAADWPMVIDTDPLFVAVNLSARQLSDAGLPDIVADALADAKLPANRLCLEITESAVFERFDVAVTTLSRLRATGVLIALDDFGTGYSSLAYLRRLPVDILKIDRSFIARLVDDVRDRAIVEAVVSIARTFGLRVVAEGVESGEQLALLRRLGCDVAQGYDIGRPGEPGEVIELARSMARHPSGRAKGPMRFVRGR
jgi:EAL domain-containing protein (putative c-di-GMP-specific phosphodiesterase class I)